MKAIALVCLFLKGVFSINGSFFDRFCNGHAKCYNIFQDPYMAPLWWYDDFAFWGLDFAGPPYVGWAETAAMAATFSQRLVHKMMDFPYSHDEWLSAAYIVLKMHSYSYVDDYFNCTTPNELGSFVMYIGLDNYLYSDSDIPYGFDYHHWCDTARFQQQYNNWNGRVRYAYEMAEFEDAGLTFEEIKVFLWVFGMHMTTTSYCPDIMEGAASHPHENGKYFCEPNPPTTMWGTVLIFGVMEDEEGIWYAAYFTESTLAENRLKWIKPSSRYYTEALQMFNVVYDTRVTW